MAFSGSLEKMSITGYKDEAFASKVGDVTVFINPAGYSQTYRILYNDRQSQGANGGSPRFNRIPSSTMRFELVFDGTGVVPSPLPGILPYTSDGIKDQIETFKKIVFSYNGKIHSPNYLKLTWGTLLFKCRLSVLDLRYTMFKPDGTPLRARANGTFIAFTDEKELVRLANNSSPDLSHLVSVKSGDTLPLLCYDVYGSSAYYLEIARVNGLENFRDLAIGRQLLFPPLRDATV